MAVADGHPSQRSAVVDALTAPYGASSAARRATEQSPRRCMSEVDQILHRQPRSDGRRVQRAGTWLPSRLRERFHQIDRALDGLDGEISSASCSQSMACSSDVAGIAEDAHRPAGAPGPGRGRRPATARSASRWASKTSVSAANPRQSRRSPRPARRSPRRPRSRPPAGTDDHAAGKHVPKPGPTSTHRRTSSSHVWLTSTGRADVRTGPGKTYILTIRYTVESGLRKTDGWRAAAAGAPERRHVTGGTGRPGGRHAERDQRL